MHIAKAVSPEDAEELQPRISPSLKYKKWIRVVETDKVPKFEISSHNMLVKAKGGGTEKMGMRIAEMPENLDRIELRDPSLGFVAYVPKGAFARAKSWWKAATAPFPAPPAMARTSKAPAMCRGWRGARLQRHRAPAL